MVTGGEAVQPPPRIRVRLRVIHRPMQTRRSGSYCETTQAANDVERTWMLIDADGKPYVSSVPGALGGHRRSRIYGRLDCAAARRALANGGYVKFRVFFAGETDARAAGYRPCSVCMPVEYARWKAQLERKIRSVVA